MALGAVLTALPGPVVVAGVRDLLNRAEAPLLIWLYDRTLVPPLLALVIRTLPLVALLLWHGLRSVNRQVLELAELEGAGPLRIFTQVGVLYVPDPDQALPELARIIWILADFWFPFAELDRLTGAQVDLREGQSLILRVLSSSRSIT